MSSTIGQLIRYPVPADHSCLFSSISFLFDSNSIDSKTLRNFIATKIESNRNFFTEAILGRSNSNYSKWIRRDDSWAGGIELAIFAEEFQTEICVINTECQCRIDHFGEDREYSSQVFLLYNNFHYEPLYLLRYDSNKQKETIEKKFQRNDPKILQLIDELRMDF